MAKKIVSIVKLQIMAGQATPAPPVGPSLAPHGINLSDFTKQFNEKTKDMAGSKIPVKVTVYEDRSFSFELKQPLAAELLKKAAGIEKGSGKPDKDKVGKITKAQLREIAQKKMPDLNTKDIESAMKIIEGTAKNMGIEIER